MKMDEDLFLIKIHFMSFSSSKDVVSQLFSLYEPIKISENQKVTIF